MDHFAYLTSELPKYIHTKNRFNHAYSYHFIKLKRFVALNIMAFCFQYLCIYHLQSPYPVYAIYPAIGITFTVISLLGANAVLGLLAGAGCAYYLKGFSASSLFFYVFADIACAWIAAYLCRQVFASDIPRHATLAVWGQFILVCALVCALSAFSRVFALALDETKVLPFETLFFIYLDLWLADLNAILIFYAFLSTWLSIYMSREKISPRKITYYHIAAFVMFIVISIFMMKKIEFIYILALGMFITMVLAYLHGIVIATLLMYVMSMLYLSYFMGHQIYYLTWLGLSGYTLVPGLLFLSVIGSGMLTLSFIKRPETILW